MIKQTHIHVKYNDFPEAVQSALTFLLEEATGTVEWREFSYRWNVYDNPEYDTDCVYQTQENVINVFLLSQNISANTTIYIDL
jgi:hypothetical protein